jgi:phosphonatase-like hydrolase
VIELAALDIAGTTVDERGLVYEVLREVVTESGATPTDDDIRRWMGTDKREAIAALVGRGTGSGAAADVERLYGRFAARLAGRYREQPPRPLPGVPGALAALRARGVRVALTTGFGRDVTGPLLDSLGWAVGGPGATVDAVVCADEVAAGRPAPYMVFRAMERTGARRVDRVLVAGDTAADLEAGTNAGAGLVVGVATGGYTLPQLAGTPHTHLVDALPDVLALV